MIALCVVMALLSPSLLSSVWSGRHKWVKMHDPPGWWYWSGPLWRGWVRILPCSPFLMISATAAVLVGAFSTKGSVGMWVVIALGLPGVAIALVIYPAVVLFARPRSVVPPSLRGQRGRWPSGASSGRAAQAGSSRIPCSPSRRVTAPGP